MSTASPLAAGPPADEPGISGRRPRDRKQKILAAAAEQFWALGYHQVGMSEVAAAVGITASALYRHYRSKQDLLVEVLNEALDQLGEDTTAPEDLDRLIAGFSALALERREFAALCNRERGHLPDSDREAITQRLRAIVARTATALAGQRPGEPSDVVDLRARAVVAVLESPSYHRAAMDTPRFEDLLRRAAAAVVSAALPPSSEHAPQTGVAGRDPQPPVSRREALLAAAVQLFSERGYPTVSLADIGAATGITGPSVYNYFASKHDLLISGLNRGNEALWLALHHALANADGPLDALHRALSSYVDFAAANPEIVSVMLSETVHLPVEQRERYRSLQHEYVAEWVALLRRSRPDLDDPEARILVNASLALPNSLVRVRRLRRRVALAAEIDAFGRVVLQVPGNRPATVDAAATSTPTPTKAR